jgi:hypothetical protein
VKQTDDFLADLEGQLRAARPRRGAPAWAVPAVALAVIAVIAVAAIGSGAGGGEREVQPAQNGPVGAAPDHDDHNSRAGCRIEGHYVILPDEAPPADLRAALPALRQPNGVWRRPKVLDQAMSDIGGRVFATSILRVGASVPVYLVPYESAQAGQLCIGGAKLDQPIAEGPGACLVAIAGDEVAGALCRDVAGIRKGALVVTDSAPRVLLGFPPPGGQSAFTRGPDGKVTGVNVTDGLVAAEVDSEGPWEWILGRGEKGGLTDEIPTVAVLNGTTISGLGESVADKVREAGFEVTVVGDYDDRSRAKSAVIYRGDNQAAAKAIEEALGLIGDSTTMLSTATGGAARDAGVIVVVGADLAP